MWESRFAHLTESPTLNRILFTFQWSRDHAVIPMSPEGQTGFRRISERPWTGREEIGQIVTREINGLLAMDPAERGGRIAEWAAEGPAGTHDPGVIYRRLATTRSSTAKRCFDGAVADCVTALGLGGSEAGFERWYTPSEQRALVAEQQSFATHRELGEIWTGCAQDGDQAACDAFLRAVGHNGWAPLGTDDRASLITVALELGGEGAWARLQQDPSATPAQALESAAGMPIADVVGAWRAWVMERRPEVYSGLLPKSGLALVWTLLFAGLAMRSTRWRLG